MVHSDSNRRWLVCASAFLAQFAVVGFMMTGGVLYTKLIDEFKASRGATGMKEVFVRVNFGITYFSYYFRVNTV